jgi:DNA-binding NarL/FixJ family response regulator
VANTTREQRSTWPKKSTRWAPNGGKPSPEQSRALRETVHKLLDEGLRQKDIAKRVGASTVTVSKIAWNAHSKIARAYRASKTDNK